MGLEKCLFMGNLDSLRDWGHAKDYVEMQWLMLQQEKPEDFVIATGKQHSVRDFIKLAAKEIGVSLKFHGAGVEEKAIVESIDEASPSHIKPGAEIIKVDPRYFRPTEVDSLLGDATYARNKLKWIPKISFEELCKEMMQADLLEAKKEVGILNFKDQAE